MTTIGIGSGIENASLSVANYSELLFSTTAGPSTNNSVNQEPFTWDDIRASFYVIYVIYPILLACCTIGNCLNLFVLWQEKPKTSTNQFMTVVAISDLFVVWMYLPFYLYNVSPTLRETPSFQTAYNQFEGIQRWTQETAIQLCDWTLIIFSLARLIAVSRPFHYKSLQTLKAAYITTAILVGLAGLFTLYDLFDSYYRYAYGIPADSNAGIPHWLDTWGLVQQQAEVSMTIFKFFALLVINGLVLMAIRRHERLVAAIGNQLPDQQTDRTRYRFSNIILISSVALYLTSQLPSLIFNCLRIADDYYGTYRLPGSTRFFINPFITMSFLINYSVNFFLYIFVSKRFRAECARLLKTTTSCCKRWRERTVEYSGSDAKRESNASAVTQIFEMSAERSSRPAVV